MMLSTLARVTQGRQIGQDVEFDTVSIDTRTLEAGDLFVALSGPNFDGHDYLDTAREKGACAAIVGREINTDLPQIVVAQPVRALGEMASWWRGCFTIPLVAVTGSNGKTSVKEMLATIFRQVSDDVLATRGNLNNELGVPLTLMRLRDRHDYAVVEMGMNHPGELSYLTQLAKPDVAVITNAAAAHLEGLGSVEAVARAKGEILSGLSDDGNAILNADDDYFPLWKELVGARNIISFGLEAAADVSATYTLNADSVDMQMDTPWGSGACRLAVPGRHNVLNALAATAAAGAAGVSLDAVLAGLTAWQGVKGRLQRYQLGDIQLIDDSYNANPASLKASIDVLAQQDGTRLLVMGDMKELGDDAAELHALIGEQAARAGIDGLLGLGELTRLACQAFGSEAKHFADHDALSSDLLTRLGDAGPATVLIKGSRSMQMERVAQALTAELGGN